MNLLDSNKVCLDGFGAVYAARRICLGIFLFLEPLSAFVAEFCTEKIFKYEPEPGT